MDTLLALDRITDDQESLVGRRAYHLRQLAQQGYRVIPSVVISAQRLRDFLSTIDWPDPFFADLANCTLRLNLTDSQQLQAIAQQIRIAMLSAPFPSDWQQELSQAIALFADFTEAVMLHPSIAAPRPQFDLERLLEPQICWRTAESLAEAIKVLWAELFRARNLLYWQKAKLSLQQFNFAILMQAIPAPACSGYLQFNGTTWDVLATRGLEIAIERGEVLPDLYRLDAHTGVMQFQKQGSHAVQYEIARALPRPPSPLVRTMQSNHQPVLDDPQLQQIHQLLTRLETTFKSPVALTWQMEAEQIYLTQVQNHGSPPKPPAASSESIQGIGAAPGQVVAIAHIQRSGDPLPSSLPPKTVLIAETIAPDWLPLLKQASAIVAEQGGMTSHGAIVARELGIPAIVSAPAATTRFQTGDRLLIDGTTGAIAPALAELSRPADSPAPLPTPFPMPPIATQLLVNLSQSELLDRAATLPVDGIGLLRSELMILTLLEQRHPRTWLKDNRRSELVENLAVQIQQFADRFAPRPVFYRSLDLRSHEFQSLIANSAISEPNPVLGLRGTFSYTIDPDIFDLELAALYQVCAAGATNLRLLLPFVRTVEEFKFCQRRVEQAGLNLPLWIMAEVPSVLFLLPDYVQAGAQGICIGTHDLTQLLLAADRDQGVMSRTFTATHPAVRGAIAQLIQSAQTLGIPCSVCYPAIATDWVDELIQLGVDAISVNLNAVEMMYTAIARAEQRLLLKKARDTRNN